ncbi:DnaA ATPase domain-containing protein [Aestuariivita boseongensis]|uniref:DnaA ATPase domain-containing protein n=1 Tax=Aestuariivita boseongensis TaxID=1470562 RepID=UPI000680ADEB|nr:DnaA/Hda family protein [Aestuariivita boseongensis]
MAEQLSFDLPGKTALGREDFFVAPSNALAVAMVEDSRNWPSRKLVLTGPAGSGKTHLAHVWAAQSGARIVTAADLAGQDIPALAQTSVVVEDVPRIAGDTTAQDALFHLHNLVLANGHALLMTGQGTPRHWALSLPDLQSRVEGTQAATLETPDDALLAAVLAKLFADRQITPRPDVIPYVVARMERSFEAAQRLVADLDRAAMAEGRSVTRRLASQLLGAA